MDGFRLNQIFMAILIALVVSKSGNLIAERLVAPKMLEKDIYIVEGVVEGAAATTPVAATSDQVEDIEPLLAAANIENGKNVAKKCVQCHTFEKGEPNKVGPNLYNIVENKVAHLDNYAYSAAMKAKGGTWTYASLNKYLHSPSKYVPGTKMAFAGLKKTQERADLIAYLRTLSDAPHPLPKK
ncbi:MAG: c-type cytochrome [Holosporales bacterium]